MRLLFFFSDSDEKGPFKLLPWWQRKLNIALKDSTIVDFLLVEGKLHFWYGRFLGRGKLTGRFIIMVVSRRNCGEFNFGGVMKEERRGYKGGANYNQELILWVNYIWWWESFGFYCNVVERKVKLNNGDLISSIILVKKG